MKAKPEQRQQALALLRDQPELSAREVARRVGVGNKTVSRWRSEAGLEQLPASDVLTSKDVCVLLEERGVRMDERRLRRWTQHGLMVPRGRQPLGRRFTYIWTRESIDQGVEVDRLLRRYRSADEALIGLFALRYPVEEKGLRDAYQRLLERRANGLYRAQKTLEAIADHSDDASWDAFAEDVFHTFATGREYRSMRRARGWAERNLPRDLQSSPAAFVSTSLLDAANVLLRGRIGDDSEMVAFFRRSNPEMLDGDHPLEEQIERARQLHRRMSVAALLRVAETSPMSRLIQDRDEVLAVVRVIDTLIFRPMIETYGFEEHYPNGFLGDWIKRDPAGFALLLIFFVSVRLSPEFRDGIDEIIEATNELLPELDDLAGQLKELLRESGIGAGPEG